MRANRLVTLLALAVAVVPTALSAHRRDEFLQAARLAISPERVELQLDLTPGIAVADAVIADIDRDGDGVLSREEKEAYAAQVLRAVSLEIDGRALRMQSNASSFPELDAFTRGDGTIALRWEAALPPLRGGSHHLSYRNTHRRDISVYLANPLMPDRDRIAINDLQRDTDQRDLAIDFALREPAGDTAIARLWLYGWIAAAAGVCVAMAATATARGGGRAWASWRRPRFRSLSATDGGSRT
jgi:hypothetical protein